MKSKKLILLLFLLISSAIFLWGMSCQDQCIEFGNSVRDLTGSEEAGRDAEELCMMNEC